MIKGHNNLSMFKNLLKYCYESKKQVCNSFPYLEKKFRDIIYLFSEDLPNTVNKYFETMFGRNDKDNDAMTFGLNIQTG